MTDSNKKTPQQTPIPQPKPQPKPVTERNGNKTQRPPISEGTGPRIPKK